MDFTFALVKPDAFPKAADVIAIARENGFAIVAKEIMHLSREKAKDFYEQHLTSNFFAGLIDFITSGNVVCLALRKDNAVQAWKELMGPADSEEARKVAPNSIRALFGTDTLQNAVHGSYTDKEAWREIKFFFPDFDPSIPTGPKAKEYLATTVVPLITKGMAKMCKEKPADPIDFLGNFLIRENPNKPKKAPIFFVLGGPGSGKGTQCAKIVEEFKFAHFSAGDLLREEAQKDTDIGKEIATMIKEGQIVPGHVTIGLLKAAIQSTKAPGVLVDGFPRKLDQAGAFEKDVSDFEFCLFFDCPENVMEERLIKRGESSGRSDDNIESIKKRFRTFVETSMPVIEYYEAKGKVRRIDATKSPEDVYAAVRKLFVKTA